MTERPTRVLVVGATGSVGRRVVAAAQRHRLPVIALVRDPARAAGVLPGADLVHGDLEKPASLGAAVQDVDAIVFTHGGNGSPDQARRIDYGGVANVLHALEGRTPRIALMTSIGVSRRGAYGGSTGQLLDWKRRSERLVRASGAACTIVRPGWFDQVRAGDDRLVLEQGDTGNGGIGRDQVAEVLVRSLLTGSAVGRTFELFAEAGDAPSDWDGVFAGLRPDPESAREDAADDEPAVVRADLARLAAR
jgi:uncharacterized protein YbjT (DUF2867 family)